MQRLPFLVYGVFCHALFLAVYAYFAAFVGGLVVPKTIDSPTGTPLPLALLVNLGLVALFGVQHSVMARPAFKRWWTRIVPEPIERSTYVLVSCLVLMLLMWQWRSIDSVVWHCTGWSWWLMAAPFVVGWLAVPTVSLMINHFDLFGTRQVWLHWMGRPYTPLQFRTPLAYAWVRHPLYVGWAIAFWATPTMTAGHLLLAASLTAYMLVAVVFEERDLLAHFGHAYADYCRRVPRFVPWPAVTQPALLRVESKRR